MLADMKGKYTVSTCMGVGSILPEYDGFIEIKLPEWSLHEINFAFPGILQPSSPQCLLHLYQSLVCFGYKIMWGTKKYVKRRKIQGTTPNRIRHSFTLQNIEENTEREVTMKEKWHKFIAHLKLANQEVYLKTWKGVVIEEKAAANFQTVFQNFARLPMKRQNMAIMVIPYIRWRVLEINQREGISLFEVPGMVIVTCCKKPQNLAELQRKYTQHHVGTDQWEDQLIWNSGVVVINS